MRIPCLATAFLVLAIVSLAQTPPYTPEVKWGIIEGKVLDDAGKPLPGATVTAYVDAKGATVTQFDANENGEFSTRLPEGSVWLSAQKTAEGYPYSFFAFFISPASNSPPWLSREAKLRKA